MQGHAQTASMEALHFIGRLFAGGALSRQPRVNPSITMTTSYTLSSPSAVRSAAGAAVQNLRSVRAAQAMSLRPRAPMLLRVAEGQAWVTLSEGPHPVAHSAENADGEYGTVDSGDVFLCVGQVLRVAAGQQVVVEAVGGHRLQFRWTAAEARNESPAPWWRRAAVGMPSAAPDRCVA